VALTSFVHVDPSPVHDGSIAEEPSTETLVNTKKQKESGSMQRIRITAVCLVVAFAFSAIAAASAFAEGSPEFVKCVKAAKVDGKYTGKYSEKACETEASPAGTGKYERTSVAENTTFTGKSKATTIKAVGVNGNSQDVVCKKDTVAGEFKRPSELRGTVTFEGCIGNGSKADKCGNSGSETIEWEAKPFAARYLEEGETEATKRGIVIPFPEGFTCGTEEVALAGILVGTVENTSKGLKIVYNAPGGHQEDRRFFYKEEENTEEVPLYTEPELAEATVQDTEELTMKGVSLRS
jgi:hypothetical protein